jgi:hypothetical protein
VKEFYNENYEEICENLFPEDLLELPEVISGYYVSNVVGGIMVSGEVREEAQTLQNIYLYSLHFLLQIIFALDRAVIKSIFSFKNNFAFLKEVKPEDLLDLKFSV